MNDVVNTRLRRYREKLLDLTKRNRLLNFRVTRASTVPIVDELPAELFDLLAKRRRPLGFVPAAEEPESPAPPAAPEAGAASGEEPGADPVSSPGLADDGTPEGPALPEESAALDGDGDVERSSEATTTARAATSPHRVSRAGAGDDEASESADRSGASVHAPVDEDEVDETITDTRGDEQSDVGPAAEAAFTREFRPYTAEAVADRHRDLLLQTTLDPERLDYNLLRIHQQARSALEEQGYNVLFLALGAVEWRDRDEPDRPLLAPIVLLPVELRRRSPRSPFHLHPTDDDPIVNPTLAMQLERELGFRVSEPPDDVEEWDLQALFADIAAALPSDTGWRVVNDTHLGLFSFTKFIMYKDLEASSSSFAESPLIRRICGVEVDDSATPQATDEGSRPSRMTDAADDTPLDERLDPMRTFQVLDADSSQQEAILSVQEGSDLVLEGPPGTGKSQTITNIIAECLAAGKRVLFVSEKMAALEVVHSRLRQVGLADFCLELHSRHASKRKVTEELARTLALTRDAPPEDGERDLRRLAEVRARLNEYSDALRTPLEPFGWSPFRAIGECVAESEAPEVIASLPRVDEWTTARFEEAVDAIERAEEARATVVEAFPDLSTHPWRGSSLEELGYGESVRLRELTTTALTALEALESSAREVATASSDGAELETCEDVEDALDLISALETSPRPSIESLRDPLWDGPPRPVGELISRLRRLREHLSVLERRWRASLLDESLDELLARRRPRPGVLSFLSPSWWRDRRLLEGYLATPGSSLPDHAGLIADLERAITARALRDELRADAELGRRLFGEAWRGEESDADELQHITDWIIGFRRFLSPGSLETRLRLASEGLGDHDSARLARQRSAERLRDLRVAWSDLAEAARLDTKTALGDDLETTRWSTLRHSLEGMSTHVESLHDHGRLVRAEREARERGLDAFLRAASEAGLRGRSVAHAFRRLFLNTWLDHAQASRPMLKSLGRNDHARLLREFRELDLRQLRLARRRLRAKLLQALPDGDWEASASSELGILQREVRRKRGHKPLRKLFRSIPNALARLKPCFLMSPLSVAQFLDPDAIRFDVVIFDEASQIAPEDALGAIARAEHLVVVGDSRQLPPTTFFRVENVFGDDGSDEDDRPDLESILDECVVAGLPRRMLRWHYRSRHESLIAFSNAHFYEDQLNTFPSANDACEDGSGVSLVHVEDGVYDRGGTQSNAREADRVAQAVLEHFRERPDLSLGVGAFSQAQQVAILDRLEELRREDESLEACFDEDRPEHFFVKNLENIQGDERDVIFLSVGYGKDASGKLHLNFGPLNQTGGERRLNVLVTRARRRLVVFSSIRSADIDDSRLSSQGGLLLKRYLAYAESRATTAEHVPDRGAVVSSGPLRRSVARALGDAGFTVDEDVGRSRLRLDLAVRDDDDRRVLGIELDGSDRSSGGTARDRHRLRQQVLEGLGWRLYPIWSPEWLRNPVAELDRLLRVVEDARTGRLEPEVTPLLELSGRAVERSAASAPAPDAAEASTAASVPYELCRLETAGEPDELGGDTELLDASLARVVSVESPVHVDEATRRVAAAWGVTRSTRSVQEALRAAADRLVERGAIESGDDGFLRSPETGERPIVRSRDVEGAPREPELIALEEIAAAAALILGRELRVPATDLTARVARLLGFQRTGSRLRERIDEGVALLVREGRAREVDGQLEPADPANG